MIRRVGRPGLVGTMARTAVVAGTATAVSGGMMRHAQKKAMTQQEAQAYEQEQQQAQFDAAVQQEVSQQMAAQAPPPAAAPPAAGGVDVVAELKKLGDLKAAGILTDEEFAAAKAKLLA
jgi:Short C-terminal domain